MRKKCPGGSTVSDSKCGNEWRAKSLQMHGIVESAHGCDRVGQRAKLKDPDRPASRAAIQ